MTRRSIKKIILPNLPYLFIALFATKLPQAWRLAEGVDASEKLLHLLDSIAGAFRSPLPSFHPLDLCIGILIAAAIRLVVYLKAKNAKKYRKNVEYGSARWGTREDIAPFMDADPRKNIILTQTEGLMMSNRPKIQRTPATKMCWWSAAPVPVRRAFSSSPISCRCTAPTS